MSFLVTFLGILISYTKKPRRGSGAVYKWIWILVLSVTFGLFTVPSSCAFHSAQTAEETEVRAVVFV